MGKAQLAIIINIIELNWIELNFYLFLKKLNNRNNLNMSKYEFQEQEEQQEA